MHIKPPSKLPYSTRQLRLDNPNTSFPANPSDELLAAWGVLPVIAVPVPEYDSAVQYVVAAEPENIGGQWLQKWEVIALTSDEVAEAGRARESALRETWKAQRELAVAAIKVTTAAGNVFDGDEVSQGRMARAILGLQASAETTVTWVLADNTVIAATAEELQEALALAGAEQARLWVA